MMEQKKRVAEYKEKKRMTEELLAQANMEDYGDEEEDEALKKFNSMIEKGQRPPPAVL